MGRAAGSGPPSALTPRPRPCLLSHVCHRPPGTRGTCSGSTSTSPWVLCKRLASQRQFRLGPVQPGQTRSPSTRAPRSYVYLQLHWREEESAGLYTTASAAEPLPQPETWATVTYAPGRKRAPRNSPHDTEAQTRQSAVFKRKIYLTSFT